jgi:hypothetical protein
MLRRLALAGSDGWAVSAHVPDAQEREALDDGTSVVLACDIRRLLV